MPNITAHRHPVLTVRCPTCGVSSGLWGRRPSGHRASDFHAARRAEADRQIIAEHGDMAAIIHAASGCLIGPRGRARD